MQFGLASKDSCRFGMISRNGPLICFVLVQSSLQAPPKPLY